MKHDPKQLAKQVDALADAGVCAKGLTAVRTLVETITGVSLAPEPAKPDPRDPPIMSVWRKTRGLNGGELYLVTARPGPRADLAVSLTDGKRWNSPGKPVFGSYSHEFEYVGMFHDLFSKWEGGE